VREHRGEILHAILTLARAWVVAGRPSRGANGSDVFAPWVETVDGILHHAGVAGRFDSSEAAVQVSVGADDEEWRDFLSAVHGLLGDEKWTAADLLARVDTIGEGSPLAPLGSDALPEAIADKIHTRGRQGAARSLGMWLKNRTGRWAGAYTVRAAGVDRKGKTVWQIEVYGS
jgi:hypothetical protein